MLRSDAGGQPSVQASGNTIGEVIDDLIGRFPGLGGKIVTDDGGLHRFVNVYVNDEDIRYLDKLETKVSDNDEISIIPAVAGG
jgi:molybdopterin converting factor small subunit